MPDLYKAYGPVTARIAGPGTHGESFRMLLDVTTKGILRNAQRLLRP